MAVPPLFSKLVHLINQIGSGETDTQTDSAIYSDTMLDMHIYKAHGCLQMANHLNLQYFQWPGGTMQHENQQNKRPGSPAKAGSAKKSKREDPATLTYRVPDNTRKEWDETVDARYPDLLTSTSFSPREYVNRMHYETEQVDGMDVTIACPPVADQPRGAPKALQECHYRDDQTQQRIIHCFKRFFTEQQQEPMMVIWALNYSGYLASAPEGCTLPKPRDLQDQNKERGDFDILMFHLKYGIFLGEIKIVGDFFHKMSQTEEEKTSIVLKKIQEEIKQLKKGEEMLKHLLSDLKKLPRIRKLWMLPNISRSQLQSILSTESTLNGCQTVKEKLCECLERADPLDICLCSDDLSDINHPLDVTADVMSNLDRWWKNVVLEGPDPSMNEEIFRDLARRFAGPATKQQADLYTDADAISFTGNGFAKEVLTPEQLHVLQSDSCPLRFITGPPGTGKTLVLTEKAAVWSRNKDGVHLLSTWNGSIAALLLIRRGIEERNLKAEKKGAVHVHHFNLKEDGKVKEAFGCLLKAAGESPEGSKELCVIADEAYCGSQFGELCEHLLNSIPKLRLWGASVYYGYRPTCLKETSFAEPLRTTPLVTKEVQKSPLIQMGFVRPYGRRRSAAPSWGPEIIPLCHDGRDHDAKRPPTDCEECGKNLAKVLKGLIAGKDKHQPDSTRSLKYRDVFIVTVSTSGYDSLRDEVQDPDGTRKPGSGMIEGLRASGVPFYVVSPGDVDALDDAVRMQGPDAVVVAEADTVRGLERKVVVWVQADKRGRDGEEDFGRLDAMSRTNAQLIVLT